MFTCNHHETCVHFEYRILQYSCVPWERHLFQMHCLQCLALSSVHKKKYPYSLIRSNNWKHRWCAKQTRVVTLIARDWKKLMVWKEKVNTTYPVLKHPFIIFKRWLNCIFHSRRLAAHASYENIETPLSAVRNQNKAKERAVYTRMECKRQCNFKK